MKISDSALVSWAQRLLQVPSQQTERFEQEPEVQNFIAGPVADILTSLDLDWRRDAMGNLIVELGQKDSDNSLHFMAYAMTHPANRMQDAFSGTIVNGGKRIRGRGAAEQKGALAAVLAAFASARDLSLKGRLILSVSTAGETGRHDAARSIIDALGFMPDKTVIVVGTSGRVALANKGRIDVEVVVKGRASHSSTPMAGVNAITGAQKVLEQVLAVPVTGTAHEGLGQPTLTATSIRSWPEATHTVQDEVRLVFDRRLLPGDDADAAFDAIARAANIGPPWTVETKLGPVMHPAEISPDGPLASAIADGSRSQGLAAPQHFHSNGSLDAGLFFAAGKEASMWGPGDMDLWHTDEESIGIDELQLGARAYFGLIQATLL